MRINVSELLDHRRARFCYGCITIGIILAGLMLRRPALGLPWPLAKYGGSALWGAMVYFIVALTLPVVSPTKKAGVAAFLAVLVECVRLYHAPRLDAFRMTTTGALLLGRIFSPWNIVAYWVGIISSMLADWAVTQRR